MTEERGYVIELAGEAAGLVVKEGNRFRFYAAGKDFTGLDRTMFRTPGEAEDACRRVAYPGRAPRPLAEPALQRSARYKRQIAFPFRRGFAFP